MPGLEPSTTPCLTNTQGGTIFKHPNLRVAYVAQHAFHHIEDFLDKTPNQYIRARYLQGEDKEENSKVHRVLSPEEEKALARQVCEWIECCTHV